MIPEIECRGIIQSGHKIQQLDTFGQIMAELLFFVFVSFCRTRRV